MRRIALISDIHGNLPALDAVAADIASAGLRETYCLGDLVGYGPEPSGVVERVCELGVPTIMGNYDEGLATRSGDCGCYYATEQARLDGEASYSFTDAALDDEGRRWLAALPREMRLEVGGLRLLLTHGSPRKINEYLMPDRSDEQLARLALEAEADVVCVGHVHIPYHRTMDGPTGGRIHYVNAGSVGKPKDGDWRGAWVELGIGDDGLVTTAVHRVEYDVESVKAAMAKHGLPWTLIQALG